MLNFNEELLNEASFENKENLRTHYFKHVLQPGEKFDPYNPKFPYMTMEEYADLAKELSEEPAGPSYDRESHVIGFMLKDPNTGNIRRCKFRKRSHFYKREQKNFPEEVIYVEDDISGHEVISYMLGRPGKIQRELLKFVSELPENQIQDPIEQAIKDLNSNEEEADNN